MANRTCRSFAIGDGRRNGVGRPVMSAIAMARLFPREAGFQDERLRLVEEYLWVHLSDPDRLSLSQAARIANVSAGHFCRLFREQVGVPFHDWQCKVRTEEAKRLVLSSRQPIDAVGRAVGYHEPSTFGRVFQRYEGITPRGLRSFSKAYPELGPALLSARWPKFVIEVVALSRTYPGITSLLNLVAMRLK